MIATTVKFVLLLVIVATDATQLRGLQQVGTVDNFRLVDLENGQTIDLVDNAVVSLEDLGMTNSPAAFNLEAVVSGTVGSVAFRKGGYSRTESVAPFALCGDDSGVHRSCGNRLGLGEHTISAQPFSQARAKGVAGTTETITFSIVEEATPVTIQLELIDVENNMMAAPLEHGDVIALDERGLSEPGFNIRANVSSNVVAVLFTKDPDYRQREGAYPFSFCGDSAGTYSKCDELSIGEHTIVVTPILLNGSKGEPLVVSFSIVQSSVVDSPVEITALNLIVSGTGESVAELTNGAVFDLQAFGLNEPDFTIQADTTASVAAVVFELLPGYKKREGVAPFTLCGDRAGTFNRCDDLGLGNHIVMATPVAEDGTKGVTIGFSFSIEDSGIATNAPTRALAANPTPVPVPQSIEIDGINLIIASTGASLALLHGSVFDLVDLGLSTPDFNIQALAPESVSAVRFYLESGYGRTEGARPFALCGDKGGNYNRCEEVGLGQHILTVTPIGQGGVKGTPLTISFTIVDSTTTASPTKAPVARPAPTPTTSPSVVSGELRKWHKITLTFEGPTASETGTPNPFLNYRLDVTFSHASSGKSYTVPGYFAADGDAANTDAEQGNSWRCHFAPDETGTWTYTVSFVTGSNVAVNSNGTPTDFDGQSGSFSIAPTNKTGRDHRGKGRLEYVDMHHLRFAETGEFFLKVGPDSPENFLSYNDFDNTAGAKDWLPHLQDWESGDPTWQGNKGKGIIGAVNYLSSVGANSFSFLTFSTYGDDPEVFPHTSKTDFTRFDVSKLAQWEILFTHADEMGMYLHFKMGEQENDQRMDNNGNLGTERKLYYRELIARFGHHLALNWNLGEEISNTIPQIKAFSDHIKQLDPYQHPIVAHNGPYGPPNMYEQLLGHPTFDGPSLQSHVQPVFATTLSYVQASDQANHKWVVCNDEQNPAINGVKPDANDFEHNDIRRYVLWGNIMAGGAGVEYFFGRNFPNDDLTCEDFRSRANMWKLSKHCLDFFHDNNVPFWSMSNSNSVRVPSNSDDWTLENSDAIVVYRPSAGSTQILDMSDRSGITYTVRWYDPRNGGNLTTGSVATLNGGSSAVSYGSPPDAANQDWVLLLQPQ